MMNQIPIIHRFNTVILLFIFLLSVTTQSTVEGATPKQIAGGSNHTCALMNGNVWCWGSNEDGQLGNGTGKNSYGATRVKMNTGVYLSNVSAIASGYDVTCALRYKRVYCWGSLYNDTLTTATPMLFANGSPISNASKVVTGEYQSCALINRQVWCWHNNGDKTTTYKVRTKTGYLNNVTDIKAGFDHFCALVSGNVWCWGWNRYGQLGDGSTSDKEYANRVRISTGGYLNNVRLLASGGTHNCVVRKNNTVWCWGENDYGQIYGFPTSDITGAPRLYSKAVKTKFTYHGSSTIKQIEAGHIHTCVLYSGKTSCFGGDNFSQSYFFAGSTRFKNVDVKSIGTGTLHTCAIKLNAVWCWGSNYHGELGDGTVNTNGQPPSLVVYANFRPFR